MPALCLCRIAYDAQRARLLRKCLPSILVATSLVGASTKVYAASPPQHSCINPATGQEALPELKINLQLAGQYLAVGQVTRAIPCLENAHRLYPGALDTVSNLGRAYLDTGNLVAAHALIENQLKTQNNPGLHDLLGEIDTRQAQFRDAARQFQLAAQADPSEQNIFDFGTSLLRFAGPSAEQIFRFGISRFPDSARMHLGLGYALWVQGQDLNAAREMCSAAKADPADPRVFAMLGDTQQIPATLQPEITARLAALVHKYPNDGQLLFYYAMALSGVWSGQDLSHLDPVVPMLERSLVLDPKLAEAHLYLARRADRNGRMAEAIAHYEQAARLRPDDEEIAYRLAFADKKAGGKAMFEKELRRFRALQHKATQKSSEAARQLETIGPSK